MSQVSSFESVPATGVTLPATEFFAAAQAAFNLAAVRAGLQRHHLTIGGKHLRLEFAGPALVNEYLRALAHLTTVAASPDLTVCLWDSVTTGVAMAAPPWSADAYLADTRIRGYWTDEIWVSYNLGSGILTMLDRIHHRALVWLHDAAATNVYTRAMPLHNLLEWWMAGHERYILHSGAVGDDQGAILLVGQGGSGKSTTALNCLVAGVGYLGDDQCLVDIGTTPHVYSLYNTGRIAPASLDRAPGLPANAGLYPSGDEMKVLYFFQETHADLLTLAAPLRALVHPRVTGAVEPRLLRARPTEIMLGLTPIARPLDAAVRKGLVAACATLARTLPCYWLELSEDRAANLTLIRQLLATGGEW